MSKVLRLQDTGYSNNLQGWEVSAKYSTDAIDQISDPNGATASKQITSIPSPFARMDLVKTAFKFVSEKKDGEYVNINRNTIYNEMVSHSLDVGQILFEYDKWSEYVDIIVWDKTNDLNALLNSQHPEHRRLGETLQLYLAQDAASYNFDRLNRLYLLNYKLGPNSMSIIGATSPSTLFFCSANDLSYVHDIFFGNDRPFDINYRPLYLRDIEYHKYLRFLQKYIPSFASLFPEVNEYLEVCYSLSSKERREELSKITSDSASKYSDLSVGTAGNRVEILGFPLFKARQNPSDVGVKSDFIIISNNTGAPKPLVLPVDTFTQDLQYTSARWDRNTVVPYKDYHAPDSRTLPNDGTPYPYLTISDFLQDTIVCMPYEFNRTAFFDGNTENAIRDKGYLLPLTSTFFDYFSADQLQKEVVPGGPKMIEISKNASGVAVILRIPIKKGFIEYKRIYFDEIDELKVDATHNDGCIKNYSFAFGMIPNIGFSEEKEAFYRLGLLTAFDSEYDWSIKCYRRGKLIPASELIRNDSDQYTPKCKTYAVDGHIIDYIQISNGSVSGIVLPKLNKKQSGNNGGRKQSGNNGDRFMFAVDFGTTNTHIEYKVNNGKTEPFDVTDQDEQIHLLGNYDLDLRYLFYADFIPQFIGEGQEFKFPLRTALSAARNTNWSLPVIPMGHANIPFTYERRMEYAYNRILSNLKWSNDQDNVKKIQCFIDSLFLLLRNKVILNNGDLTRTKIIWFYPISMTKNRFNLFNKVWEDAYRKYFGSDISNLVPMTESVAPFKYALEHYQEAQSARSVVTIDIGGGTSDVVIGGLNKVKYITSFRYAANSIFGDGYANCDGAVQNGIIRQFKGSIETTLKENKMDDLLKVFSVLDNRNDSTDIASFFFSLTGNKRVIDKNLAQNLDFHRMLQLDERQKVVFLLFYTSIIYHVAKIMKAKQLDMPRYITFSGNGSRVISVLSEDEHLLAKYTKLIYEKVYASAYNNGEESSRGDLTIKLYHDHPKEATCKGGIIGEHSENYDSIAQTKVVLMGTDDDTFVDSERYADISESSILKTSTEVKHFIQLMLALNEEFSFKNNFGIDGDSLSIVKTKCFLDLEIYTRNGLRKKQKEVKDDDTIEETMFFYPLVGTLNMLAASICDNNNNGGRL